MAFRNKLIKDIPADVTTDVVYCMPGYEIAVHSLYISNKDITHSAFVDIKIEDTYVGNDIEIPPKSSLILDKTLNLQSGQALKAYYVSGLTNSTQVDIVAGFIALKDDSGIPLTGNF